MQWEGVGTNTRTLSMDLNYRHCGSLSHLLICLQNVCRIFCRDLYSRWEYCTTTQQHFPQPGFLWRKYLYLSVNNILSWTLETRTVFACYCHNPSPKSESKVKSQKSKGLGVTLFCCATTTISPPVPHHISACAHLQKLFSATRHPIKLKFSQ